MSNSSIHSSNSSISGEHSEKLIVPGTGWMALAGCLGALGLGAILLVSGAISENAVSAILGVVMIPFALIGLFGLMAIAPNDSRVLLLFGDYKGTVKQSGFFWVNPFYSKKRVSLRIRNFETGSTSNPEKKDSAGTVVQQKSRSASRPSKVNDRDGNPIEISAVVVWRVVDTAEALFEVDDYQNFVEVQSEAALRNLATRYPYDSEDHEESLRGSTDVICSRLRDDIQERLHTAGVMVIEARISHLAYAAEIASAMLQRQQAGAVVAARTKIVDGAVGMVDMALDHLKRDNIVELDDQQRATLVSNLLVVLCSDRHTQPVVQAGS
ncbi:regulator of protease activity HflC (stomatin/prohibitin superfamily) [Rhodopirellula rubra]|uniref:Regulator of protease activity HflC (Stomatin/prohibitin superfamily) n=1 Tax=Aporhodopirellula rubra TaxID=980271 RepID=A0A7W5DVG2_9BACT|nr:SPFH domain-containing protein [Aporhodopirellula rubra]MBB3204808.1 regulator of protease activity HflC (stomatin/prohibitin superfamily) [Aporhodopirellula rubra]